MPGGQFEAQAAHAPLPGPGTQYVVPNGASSAAFDLSGLIDQWVLLIASTKTHIRAGDSTVAAAATTDVWLPADLPVQFKVTRERCFIRLWGASAAGVLSVAPVG